MAIPPPEVLNHLGRYRIDCATFGLKIYYEGTKIYIQGIMGKPIS